MEVNILATRVRHRLRGEGEFADLKAMILRHGRLCPIENIKAQVSVVSELNV